VPWGSRRDSRTTLPEEPDWLQQVWFAGNHSDIGGSYPENESRLSDAPLRWMVEAAETIPDGLKIDRSVLRTYPSADGMHHDEGRGLMFRFTNKINRKIDANAVLHPSVYDRFALPAVLQYDLMLPYRPESLRHHEKLTQYY